MMLKSAYELAFYFMSRVLPSAINFITVTYLVVILNVSDYSIYSNEFALATLLSSVISGLFTQSIIRYYPGCDNVDSLITNWIFLIISVNVITLFSLILFDVNYYTIALIIAMVIFNVICSIYQVKSLAKKFFVSNLIRATLYIFFVLIMSAYFKHSNPYSIICLMTASFIIPMIIYSKDIKSFIYGIDLYNKTSINIIRKILSFAIPISVWIALFGSNNYIFRIVVSEKCSSEMAGFYIKSFDIFFNLVTVALSFVITWSHPKLSRFWNERNLEGFNALKLKVLIFQLMIGILSSLMIIFIFYFFKEQLYNLNFYNEIAPIYMVLAACLSQVCMISHKTTEMRGNIFIMILLMIISVALNYTLMNMLFNFGLKVHSLISFPISQLFYIFLVTTYERNKKL